MRKKGNRASNLRTKTRDEIKDEDLRELKDGAQLIPYYQQIQCENRNIMLRSA
jgi:hypothetical protein